MNIDGHEYAVRNLQLTTQFSLASKLSPVVALMALQKDRVELRRTFPKSFTALCETMQINDQKWIIDTCLGAVTRVDPGVPPVPVWVGGMPAFQDIGLRVMMELIWEVINHHGLIDFFSVDPSTSDQPIVTQELSGSVSQKDAAG